MDRATLDAHTAFRGSEDKPLKIDLHRLTTAEQTLYDDLRDNRIADSLRLEQEHLGYTWVLTHLRQRLGLSDGAPGYPALSAD